MNNELPRGEGSTPVTRVQPPENGGEGRDGAGGDARCPLQPKPVKGARLRSCSLGAHEVDAGGHEGGQLGSTSSKRKVGWALPALRLLWSRPRLPKGPSLTTE